MRRTRDRPLPAGRLDRSWRWRSGSRSPLRAPRPGPHREPPHRPPRPRRARVYVAGLHAHEAALDARALRRGGPGGNPAADGLDGGHRPARRGGARALRPPVRVAAPALPRHLALPARGLRPRRPEGVRGRPRRAGDPPLDRRLERPAPARLARPRPARRRRDRLRRGRRAFWYAPDVKGLITR